jgi:putative ABC transport system permease protein
MPITEAFLIAVRSITAHKLRSFFTLLGIIVSVAFLVAVVAIIQGMNSYVSDKLAGAIVGTNAFQVRREPIAIGQLDDEEWREIQKRPLIDERDAEFVRRALPDAAAIAMQSGFPTPLVDIHWSNRTVGDVFVFGVTAPFQIVQDYRFAAGEPLSDIDVRDRRYVVVLGWDVADKLFGEPERAVGRSIRLGRLPATVKGVTAKKGTVLGQSFDGFALIPFTTFESLYGRRQTITISVKMPPGASIEAAMARSEEAMRIARHLRPGEPNNFAVDKADALVEFWTNLTQVLFTVIPAVVAIGLIVGGIVIMNIMLMSVRERTREIGIRKSLGARRRDIRRQFLAESATLAFLGGALGVAAGWLLASTVSVISPLPARVTPWSISVALALGASIGIVFGVYPAARAARLDPVTALRQE